MDVFRYAKLPQKPNDPTRRYRITQGQTNEHVGSVEVVPPKGDMVVMSVTCLSILSDAAREDALNTTRRFLDELAHGWGVQLLDVSGANQLEEHPDGNFHIRLEYRTA